MAVSTKLARRNPQWRVATWCLTAFLVLNIPATLSAQPFFAQHDINHDKYYWSVYAADIDGDNDLDLVTGQQSGQMAWWENDNGDFTEHIVQEDGDANGYSWQSASSFAIDMDGDSDLDIVGGTVHFDEIGINQINWWENDGGDGTSWIRHVIDEDNPPGFVIGFLWWAEPADIDDDSDMDIAAAFGDKIYWYSNDGGGDWTRYELETSGFPNGMTYARCAHPCDLDGDGDLEVVGCSYGMGRVRIYWDHSSSSTDTLSLSQAWCVIAFDADNDGYDDLAAVGANTTKFWLYLARPEMRRLIV